MVTYQLKLKFFTLDNGNQIKTFNILSTCTDRQIAAFAASVADLIEDWSTYDIYKIVTTPIDSDYD